MPIYEYKCTNCQHQSEKLENISAPKLQRCPECNQDTFIRQVSRSHFQLQGKGWYVTDFKDNNATKAETDTQSSSETSQKTEKTEKAEKTEKTEKTEKAEKTEKTKKTEKTEKAEKTEKKGQTKKQASNNNKERK